MYLYICIYVCIYIYIEREREAATGHPQAKREDAAAQGELLTIEGCT